MLHAKSSRPLPVLVVLPRILVNLFPGSVREVPVSAATVSGLLPVPVSTGFKH